MPEVFPLAPEDDHTQLSRRSFLVAGAVAASIAWPILAGEHGEKLDAVTQTELLKAPQRAELLERIQKIISEKNSKEDRHAQLNELPPLIDQYRTSIAEADDLTVEELSRAVTLNRIQINMTYFSSGMERQAATHFLKTSSIQFYDDLFTQLEQMRGKYPNEMRAIDSAQGLILTDLIWSQNHGLRSIDPAVATVVADRFLAPSRNPSLSQIKSCLAYGIPVEHPEYTVTIFERSFDTIAEALRARTLESCRGENAHPRDTIESIVEVAALASRWLPMAKKSEVLSDAQIHVWSGRISEKIEKPLFEKIIPLYLEASAEPKATPRENTRFFIFPVSASHVTERPLLGKFIPFVNGLEGCRVEMGKQFTASYDSYLSSKNLSPSDRLKVAPLLAYLAPEPATKRGVVDDLRTAIAVDGGRAIDPKLSAGLLEVLLFSDQMFAAHAKNNSYRSANAVQICVNAMSGSEDISAITPSITPAQQLFMELVRMSTSANGWKSISYAREATPELRSELRESARQSVYALIGDIYWLAKNTSISDSADDPHVTIRLPEWWGGREQSITETTRVSETKIALRDLISLVDGVTAQLARFDLDRRSEEALIERLLVVTQALDLRSEVRNIPFSMNADPLAVIKDSFPHLWSGAERGPFPDLYRKVRNMIYLAHHKYPAPPYSEQRNPLTDKALDELALNYAKLSEERFITSFILRLWNPDGNREQRPLEAHQRLSPDRMAMEARRLLAAYGMLEKYEPLKDIIMGEASLIVDNLKKHQQQILINQQEAFERISAIVDKGSVKKSDSNKE